MALPFQTQIQVQNGLQMATGAATGKVMSSDGSGNASWGNPQLIPYGRTGVLTVAVGTARFYFPQAIKVVGVTISVGTAPTGANIICDVNKNGTTIFTTQANRPTITATNFNSTEAVPDSAQQAFSAGDYISVDVDQVGSSIAGSDLTVTVRTA